MSVVTRPSGESEIIYPDSDGQPMAENTLQWEWIVTLKGGLDALFAENPDVFVAGDLLWYPVEGDPLTRCAPDAMVAFGRPKGYRGSYKQWEEGGIAPQVVFEVLSPGNRAGEMRAKLGFYERFGVQEYYIYDPDRNTLEVWLRQAGVLRRVPKASGWISPLLGVRFELGPETLQVFRPDGKHFQTYLELAQHSEELAQRSEALVRQRDLEKERAERLAAQLRALGIEPEA
jgi:Uma2 family endonuclease